MRVIQQRLLRGANLYSASPCIVAIVDTGDLALARQLARTVIGLQQACGQPVAFQHAEPEGKHPLRSRIVVQYALEHLGQAALAAAADMQCGAERSSALPALRALAASLELPVGAQALMAQAATLGIPVRRVSEHAGLLRLGWGSRQWRFLDGAAPDTRLLTQAILGDRHLTRLVLEQAQVAMPGGAAVHTLEDALRVAARLGWPVCLRSVRSARSDSWRCGSAGELRAAFAQLGQPVSGLPATHAAQMIDIQQAVPGERVTVQVKEGQLAHACAAVRQMGRRAVQALGLDRAELEFVDAGDDGPLLTALRGRGRQPDCTAAQLMQDWRGRGENGRLPVIAVTGTNGKTTTTLMIAHAVSLAGLRTGCASTQGIVLDGDMTQRGDCTGYWSHRAVLDAPQTDFAVLETARGGLLKRGLAFDRCDVGVLLNISDDHLGLDGVDTVEALARVKSLVVAGARTAVLNAEDPLCVAARARLMEGARVMFFAMDAGNEVLRAHLAQGGDGVWLEEEVILLQLDGRRGPVLPARDIPATMGGLARFNIANSLAATAALAATGFDAAAIAAGLSSFVSDAASNPLRSNLFRVGELCILLDYAHNPAAYHALGGLARGLARNAAGGGEGRVLAVVSSPGDRRDDDLLRTGAACAASFDQIYAYESATRGRPQGQTSQLIGDGARAAGAQEVRVFASAESALQSAYLACRPGDVLMFSCGTVVETLVETIRAVNPAAAEAIERQRRAKPEQGAAAA